jgi:uncharacterized repeat protein (TIGR03803 family)
MKDQFLVPVLAAVFGLMLAGQVTAQTFTTLYSFTATDLSTGTNSDGANPHAGLILSGSTLFGTTEYGGSEAGGTVFKVNTDGSGFRNLDSFIGLSEPANPLSGLITSGNTLYGTAGTVFKVNTDGSGFTNVYAVSDFWLSGPSAVILLDKTLYGTTSYGGSLNNGRVFAVNTDGTGFTNLHSFAGFPKEGAWPSGGLIISHNTLYGTTQSGGTNGSGTVFAVNTDGTGFTNLYSFTGLSDGANPEAGLIISGSTLYGTTQSGGTYNTGTVFALNTNGTSFTTLYSLNGGSDGYGPSAGLVLSGTTLYGTASGGFWSSGTVFALNTDGTGFTNVYNFTGGDDGDSPIAGLIISGNTLYGTASGGGSGGKGTVFSLSLPIAPPQLTIIPSGPYVILAWPTNYTGFTLQSTTNLGSSAVWITNSPAPVVVNVQNVVTNPISGTQQFFRLSQ